MAENSNKEAKTISPSSEAGVEAKDTVASAGSYGGPADESESVYATGASQEEESAEAGTIKGEE